MALSKPRIQPEPTLFDRPQPQPGEWTYDDYCAIPDDGRRYEVIDGELYMAPSPIPLHQHIQAMLTYFLVGHTRDNNLGDIYPAPLDVVLSLRNVVQPDLMFIHSERRHIVGPKNITAEPDLVVEILSPGTRNYDRRLKAETYAAFNIRFLWLIDAATRRIEEFELRDGQYALMQQCAGNDVFSPAVFPGLAIPLAEVWG